MSVKATRDLRVVEHEAALRKLVTALGEDPASLRRVKAGAAAEEAAFRAVTRSHVDFVLSIKAQVTQTEHSNFMKAIEDKRNTTHRDLEEKLEELGEVEDETKVKEAGKKAALRKERFLKADVEALVAVLEQGLEVELSQAQFERYDEMYQEVSQKVKVEYPAVLGELEAAGVDEKTVEAAEAFLATKLPKIMELRGKLASKLPKPEVLAGPPPQTRQEQGRRIVPELKALKLGSQQIPQFDGSARNYGVFKKFWQENVEKEYTESAKYTYLMNALPETVKRHLTSVANDAGELWEQLDVQYGTPEVVGRQVTQELFELDPRKHPGGEYIIKLSNMLEETEVLLLQHNQLEWLTSPNAISQLEEKLPYEAKKDWAEKMDTYVGTKYEKLKAFLKQKRLVAEKMKSIGTTKFTPKAGEETGCTEKLCKEKGHKRSFCPMKPKAGEEKDDRTCYKCGEGGHIARNCSKEASGGVRGRGRGAGGSRGGSQGGSRSGGRARGDAPRDSMAAQESHSNTVRKNDCVRCKYIGAQISQCSGCSVKKDLDHCLYHCEGFMMEGVEARVQMAKKGGYCPVCLYPGHDADKCKNASNDRYICGQAGCLKHHHPVLHGSKDKFVTAVNVVEVEASRRESSVVEINYEAISKKIYDNFGEAEVVGRARDLEEIKRSLEEQDLDGGRVLMVVQEIDMLYDLAGLRAKLVCFFDNGSTCSAILTEVAERYKLCGVPVTIRLTTVHGTKAINTKLYGVELLDQNGDKHLVKAFGLETISGPIPVIQYGDLKMEFSTQVQERWELICSRPEGRKVELLVGSEVAGLHPTYLEEVGDLVVLKTRFGTGYTMYGTAPGLAVEKLEWSATASAMRMGGLAINQLKLSYTEEREHCLLEEEGWQDSAKRSKQDMSSQQVLKTEEQQEKDFWAAEQMGCEAPRRCKSCRGCNNCSF